MVMVMRFSLLCCLCSPSMLLLSHSFRLLPPHRSHPQSRAVFSGNGLLAATKLEETMVDAGAAININNSNNNNRTVTILQRSANHIVALKPPAVICHHSGWAGSRAKTKRGEEPEIPMLQRVRDAIHDIDTRDLNLAVGEDSDSDSDGDSKSKPPIRKVNLVHRLDRGASGCLLFTYAEDDENSDNESDNDSDNSDSDSQTSKKGDTAQLIEAMKSPDSIKTYVALVRGEGILRGENLRERGWFEVNRAIKNDSGTLKNATTMVKFVSGQAEAGFDRPRMSLVLARPKEGRWHQIRKHLNGLSHPILGDSIHGHSKTNGEWKSKRNLPGERIALHLGRMQLVPTENMPEGIDISAPLMEDMLEMLRVYAPDVLKEAMPVLEKEGIVIEAPAKEKYEVGKWTIPEALLQPPKVVEDVDIEILEQGEHYVVASKPPTVVVHHSSWTGKRSDPKRRRTENTPMLQRVRDKTGRRVNLVHRLDRGASGCLLLSFAENKDGIDIDEDGEKVSCGVTKSLIESMQNSEATKTYVALCDGDGTWNGVNYLEKGWFTFNNPVKDEWGKFIEDARTDICFVASTTLPPIENASDATSAAAASADSGTTAASGDGTNNLEGRKISIVLTRPHTGRWHQIRQHLSSGKIGHAILGDSSHGRSRTNRIWKKKRHLMKERTCLHLCRIQLPATEYSPEGVDVTCPLPPDLMKMLKGKDMRGLRKEARPILAEEGIII